jgi:hypothetical protein
MPGMLARWPPTNCAAHFQRRVVYTRLDRKATAISLLVVIGVLADAQKVLLAVKSMGGESSEASQCSR